jgi:FixJ family two-component response regulator
MAHALLFHAANSTMSAPCITIVDDDAVRDSLALSLNFRGFRCRIFPSAAGACLAT